MHKSSSWKDERLSGPREDREHLLSEVAQAEAETGIYSSVSSRRNFSWQLFLLGFFLSVLFIGLGILIGKNIPKNSNFNSVCLKSKQKWSPIQDEVDNSYKMVHFNGSFFRETIFRQPASPEVDAAWESLGVNYRAFAVPSNQAEKSGFRRSQVQINPAYGGGYPANVEGLHHLHCLNLVRQALYYNIDYYRATRKGAFANDDFIVRRHVSHCLDIIRQQLMCTPNTALLGQIWWDRSTPKAFVDFNTEHKCRNYEAIREWAEKRQLPEKVADDFLLPPKRREDVYEKIP